MLAVVIAIFKQYEMTFIPFVLSLIRFNINAKQRIWLRTIDSFHAFDIKYIPVNEEKSEDKIDFSEKIDKMSELEKKLKNI